MPRLDGQAERRVAVGYESGLFVVEESRGHGFLLTLANESALEYTVTLCFDQSENLRLASKQFAAEQVDPQTYRMVLAPFQTKKFITAAPCDPAEPAELKYSTSATWRAAKAEWPEVAALKAIVADFASADDDPDHVGELCRRARVPFLDLAFPPTVPAAGSSDTPVWLRPEEFLPRGKAHIFEVGHSPEPHQLLAGSARHDRFLSCLAVLAERPRLLRRCIPTELPDLVRGMWKARVCQDGIWKVVAVDTYIPCDSNTGRPLYVNTKGGELWPNVLLKAYAKLFQGFALDKHLDVPQFLSDFTGFPCSQLRFQRDDLDEDAAWGTLQGWLQAGDLLVCSAPKEQTSRGDDLFPIDYVKAANARAILELLDSGVQESHSYAVVDLQLVKADGRFKRLVKLRNHSWANLEGTGDAATRWEDSSPQFKQQLELDKGPREGIFWLPFNEVCRVFNSATACHHRPTWHDLRVRGCFADDRAADVCFEFLQPERGPVQFVLTQPAALTQGKKYRYIHCALFILRPVGPKYELLACSEFCSARQVFISAVLEKDSRPYLVVPVSFEYGRTQPFTLAAISPHLRRNDVQLRAGSRDLAERCELLACRRYGKERAMGGGRSVLVMQVGKVAIVAALNTRDDLCHAYFDFRGLVRWTSHNIYNDVTDIHVEIPPGNVRFVETFFNAGDSEFVFRAEELPGPLSPFLGTSFTCPEVGPVQINSSLLRLVAREIQYEADTALSEPAVPSVQTLSGSTAASLLPALPASPSSRLSATAPLASPMLRSPPARGSPTAPRMLGCADLPPISPTVAVASQSPIWKASEALRAADAGAPLTVSGSRRWFNELDRHGNGYLSRTQVRFEYEKLDAFGSPMSRQALDELFSLYDRGDDRMEFDEFCILMMRRAKW